MSILIRDTTREEREKIVAESIGNISGLCDGCSPGIIEMYQDYIDGKKELREINMEFNARYTLGDSPETSRIIRSGETDALLASSLDLHGRIPEQQLPQVIAFFRRSRSIISHRIGNSLEINDFHVRRKT